MAKQIPLSDIILDQEMLDACVQAVDHEELVKVVQDNLTAINQRTGQDNDPAYLAYLIEFVVKQVKEDAE